PPISIMRSTRLSRPVVSVSKMISRIQEVPAGEPPLQIRDDLGDPFSGRFDAMRGIDHIIGSCALFRIRRLARKNHIEFFHCHAWPRKYAFALYLWITANDHDHIDPALGS